MKLNELLKNKTFEKEPINKIARFQDYAIDICKKFNIDKDYRQIIFRHAKRNMCYLEGKVALCIEKFGDEGCKNKGRYLISLFRKQKPWEK